MPITIKGTDRAAIVDEIRQHLVRESARQRAEADAMRRVADMLSDVVFVDAAPAPAEAAPADEGPECPPVNLDCMSQTELYEFWTKHTDGHNASDLFPTLPRGCVKATRDLAIYAANKGTAMSLRAEGDITGAGQYEQLCDSLYNSLPSFARW